MLNETHERLPPAQAWAVHKGKYREGRDKADPTMWKTRLRCALNKSTDFEEVPDRNQLDITEPYKVYRIQSNSGPPAPAGAVKKLFKCLCADADRVATSQCCLYTPPNPPPLEEGKESQMRKSPRDPVAPCKQVKLL